MRDAEIAFERRVRDDHAKEDKTRPHLLTNWEGASRLGRTLWRHSSNSPAAWHGRRR